MRKHYSLLLCINLFAICVVKGHHILGGTMYYACIPGTNGQVTIEITLELLRDADGGGALFDNPAEFGVWSRSSGGQIQFLKSVNAHHWPPTLLEFEEHAAYPNGRRLHAELTSYNFSIDVPDNGTGYIVAYRRCCRIDDLKNVMDSTGLSQFEPGATYAVEITPEAIAATNVSPMPLRFAQDFLIPAGVFQRDLQFIDPDGDEVRYTFEAPLKGGSTNGGTAGGNARACDGIRPDPSLCPPDLVPIDFRSGFSVAQPFGDSTDVTLDEQSGLMSGTLEFPGFYVVGILAREYRNGVLLSEILMDYTFRVPLDMKVSGAVGYRFFDGNENSVRDPNEPLTPQLLMRFIPDVLESKYHSDGGYSLWADPGQYEFRSLNPMFKVSATPPFLVNLDMESQQHHVDIPFVAAEEFTDLDLLIWSSSFRCNQEMTQKVMVCNLGSTVQSGEILLTLDGRSEFISADQQIEQINTHQFLWRYDSLYPFQKLALRIKILMPSEDFVGENLQFSAMAKYFPVNSPLSPDTTTFTIKGVLRCGVDPNDKTTHPIRGNANITLPDEYITYTIRFQNTGNDTARSVRILDQLNPFLNIYSLRIVDASHPFWLESVGSTLNITFSEINLPDSSTDYAGSQGYVVFKIKPVPTVVQGQIIPNFAHIFFDQNSAIYTNTVSNLISKFINEGESQSRVIQSFTFYPNPGDLEFTIRYPEFAVPQVEFRLYAITGQLISRFPIHSNFVKFGHDLPPGIYFYHLRSEDGLINQSGKVIKTGQ